uniref:OO_Ba0013J05-OO_Ba0033A15.19 protein n=1 Tax=Oryza officinalis TaxID=4535 RepID=D0ABG2_9ORYZ|nr:OO_Ba0013J05-OO_Ba0033A15.19 [Oryza officinalis]
MSKQSEIFEEYVVSVTVDQLNEEQRAEMDKLVEQFQNMYLQTYSRTRQGTLIQKSKVVMPSPGDGASTSAAAHGHAVKNEENATPTLQDCIDFAVHSAVVNQSGILVNTLTNTVKSILDGSIHQYKPQGPIFLPENKFPAYRTLRTDLSTAPQPTAPIPPPSAQPASTLPLVLTRQTGGSPQHITEEQYVQWTKGKQSVVEPMQQVPVNPPSAKQPQFPMSGNPPQPAAYNAPQGYQQYTTGISGRGPAAVLPPGPPTSACKILGRHDSQGDARSVRLEAQGEFYSVSAPISRGVRQSATAELIQDPGLLQIFGARQRLYVRARKPIPSTVWGGIDHRGVEGEIFPSVFVKEAKKFAKKINTIYQYASEEDADVDLAEWARMKKQTTCQWAKKGDKDDKYDFDINKADKIFDLLLQEKQIQLPVGHVLPSAEEIKKRRYCKWHNTYSHHTNECKIFRQQIQSAIEQGRIKIDEAKRPMKIEGHPFPVNMVRADRADGNSHRTGKRPHQTSEGLIKKYQRPWEEQAQDHADQDNSYDPHWECEFFRFCWNEGMRLPSIQECPACNDVENSHQGSSSKQVHRPRKQRKSVHERLGPMHHDRRTEHDEQIQNPQWCPSDVFSKTQKRWVQRLRRKEQIQEQQATIAHRPAKTKKEWRIKSADSEYCVQTADEAIADDEQSSAKLRLSPDQAVFDKPVDTSHRLLRPLYIKGFVNGQPMTKMLVDGGASVNLMPYTTFRKFGKVPEDLIKTSMVLKDFGDNTSEGKGVLNVELTVGNKTIPTTFFVFDGKGSYSLLWGRDWIHANCCVPSTMHQCLIQWQGDQVEIVQADCCFNKDVPSTTQNEQASLYTDDAVDELDGKLGQGFMSADQLEDVDIGSGDRPRPTYVSANLSREYKNDLINLLKEFIDCFAWEYHEMPGLSRSIIEHWLPIKPGYRPFKQAPWRFKADMHEAIKAEITGLYDANFIRPCRYAEWVSNIVPVLKKNGKLRVCIDFRDLNKATPKDEYPMPLADLLVDATSGHKIISFMDGNAGYNQIFMAEEDIHKTAFRCPGAIGLYEWVVMTFGLKNAGATYQRAMNYIFHDLIGSLIEVYIDDVVVKSKEYDMHLADLRKFLGFLVHERGIEITKKSVDAIKNIKPPTNKTKLQSLLGKINFVRRFISNLSGRIEPFTPLLKIKDDQEFVWGDKQQKALDDIKEYLSSPPVLIPLQKRIPFRLYLSADEKSIGSVLVQDIDDKERAIFYLSRRLLDDETRHYLLSNECIVVSKADVMKYMLSAPVLKGRIGKWIFALTEFDLRYESAKAIKGQALADFIVQHRDDSITYADINFSNKYCSDQIRLVGR